MCDRQHGQNDGSPTHQPILGDARQPEDKGDKREGKTRRDH
jgi:hypothetical protein